MKLHLSKCRLLMVCLTLLVCSACSYINQVEPIIDNPSNVDFPVRQRMTTYHFVKKEYAQYPKEALKLNLGGTVIVHARLNIDGSVFDAYIPDQVHPVLDEEALQATRACVFGRTDYDGGLVRDEVKVMFKFE